MVLDDRKYVNDCYDLLMELEIIDSKYQFSEQFLGQCKNYYGVMLSENRRPTNNMLYNLSEKMEQLSECFTEPQFKQLAEDGQQILMSRLDKYLSRK